MEYPLPCNGVSVAVQWSIRCERAKYSSLFVSISDTRCRSFSWPAALAGMCLACGLSVRSPDGNCCALTMPFLYSLTELSHFSASNNSCLRSIFRKETDMFPNLLLPLHRIIINLRENEVYEKQCFQTTADGCAGVRPRLSVLWYVRYARRNPAQSSCGSPAARSTPTRCPTIPTTICTG